MGVDTAYLMSSPPTLAANHHAQETVDEMVSKQTFINLLP